MKACVIDRADCDSGTGAEKRALYPDVQGPDERVGVRELGQELCCHVTSTCTAAWGVVRRFWTHPRQQSMERREYFKVGGRRSAASAASCSS